MKYRVTYQASGLLSTSSIYDDSKAPDSYPVHRVDTSAGLPLNSERIQVERSGT